MHYTYIIVRDDGQKYVGVTNNIQRRKSTHKLDDRFKGREFEMSVVFESESRDAAELKETELIEKMNTFRNGLNRTKSGRGHGHNSPHFSTLGRVFSEESKEKMKMNHWSKTGKYNPKGHRHSEEAKAKMSATRKGKPKSNPKIPLEERHNMIEMWKAKSLEIGANKIQERVHPTQHQIATYENLMAGLLKKKNGGRFEVISMYAYHYAEKLNVTTSAIFNILRNVENDS